MESWKPVRWTTVWCLKLWDSHSTHSFLQTHTSMLFSLNKHYLYNTSIFYILSNVIFIYSHYFFNFNFKLKVYEFLIYKCYENEEIDRYIELTTTVVVSLWVWVEWFSDRSCNFVSLSRCHSRGSHLRGYMYKNFLRDPPTVSFRGKRAGTARELFPNALHTSLCHNCVRCSTAPTPIISSMHLPSHYHK